MGSGKGATHQETSALTIKFDCLRIYFLVTSQYNYFSANHKIAHDQCLQVFFLIENMFIRSKVVSRSSTYSSSSMENTIIICAYTLINNICIITTRDIGILKVCS